MKSQCNEAEVGALSGKAMEITIKRLDLNSPFLPEVKMLGRANSATLGFFPEGAFDDYAKKGQILIGIQANGLRGYLMYRPSGQKIIIVHLCIDKQHRGKGVASQLVEYLEKETKAFLGIGLRCRRDYGLDSFWQRLGFLPIHERAGRGKDQAVLTYWSLDHGHPTLFSSAQETLGEIKLSAVLDANVFFDLLEGESRRQAEESKALLADWIADEVELVLTPEIYNEINRNEEEGARNRSRSFADRFSKIKTDEKHFQAFKNDLLALLTTPKAQDRSDVAHIAYALAADADFFVTRDEKLLEHSDAIYTSFALTVLRPCDMVVRLDTLTRQAHYHPSRLAGSRFSSTPVRSGQEKELAGLFQSFASRESKAGFQARLRISLANPQSCQTLVIADGSTPIGLLAYNHPKTAELDITIFRIRPHKLGKTIAAHLILKILLLASQEKRTVMTVSEQRLAEPLIAALKENGFVKQTDIWIRFSLPFIGQTTELFGYLAGLQADCPEHATLLAQLHKELAVAHSFRAINSLLDIERRLWPAKMLDLAVPTYLIPVKLPWAIQLFDEGLANQTLFGAEAGPALSRDNVYYRAKRPHILTAPARILWYVSDYRGHHGSKQVRACSYLDEVVIGPPKELFSRFRRLGTYEWPQILALANNDLAKEIMALRFSQTELFSEPITLNALGRAIAEVENRNINLVSPFQISARSFEKLYLQATGHLKQGVN